MEERGQILTEGAETRMREESLLLSRRIGGVTEVRLDGSVAREDLVGLLLGDGGNNDNVLSRLPVDGGGDSVLGSELQGNEHALDFVKVAASRGRVGQSKLKLAIRTDDENRANGEGVVGIGVNHAVQVANLAVGIREDGVANSDLLGLFNVLNPALVVLDTINGERNDLGVESLKVSLQTSNSAQLGGANGLICVGSVRLQCF